MATIRKRAWKSGGEARVAWVADYRDQGGTRRLKTFKTRKEADGWLVGARAQVVAGTHTADSASVTIAQAAERWLEGCEANGLERQTIRTYRINATYHVLPLLGAERLSRLTAPQVEGFRDELLRTRSRVLAGKALTVLKMIIGDAERRGLVAQNVARAVRIRTSGRQKTRVAMPSKEEIRLLLAAVAPRWRPLIVTAVFTGLRASELRGLTWSDVDLEAKVLQVRQRADRWNRIGPLKSGASQRTVPLAPMVLNALREWRLACPKGQNLVFPTGAGRVESLANIWNRGLAPTQVAAGIVGMDGKAKYGLHALRHFFASWLIDQGFGAKRVQALMGHSSIGITFDVYGHLFPQEDDQARFAAGELTLIAG